MRQPTETFTDYVLRMLATLDHVSIIETPQFDGVGVPYFEVESDVEMERRTR